MFYLVLTIVIIGGGFLMASNHLVISCFHCEDEVESEWEWCAWCGEVMIREYSSQGDHGDGDHEGL